MIRPSRPSFVARAIAGALSWCAHRRFLKAIHAITIAALLMSPSSSVARPVPSVPARVPAPAAAGASPATEETATPALIETPTASPTQTAPPTAPPAPTETQTALPTQLPAPTNTPTQLPAPSNTPTQTPAPANTPTQTPAPANTPTQTPAPANTPTQTPASTPPPDPTGSPPPAPTETPAATAPHLAAPQRPLALSSSGITLYGDPNYSGTSEEFTADDPDLSDNAIGSDSASSVQVQPGLRARLFDRPDYRGWVTSLAGDTPNLSSVAFDDIASSIKLLPDPAGPLNLTDHFDGPDLDPAWNWNSATGGPTYTLDNGNFAMTLPDGAYWDAIDMPFLQRYDLGRGDFRIETRLDLTSVPSDTEYFAGLALDIRNSDRILLGVMNGDRLILERYGRHFEQRYYVEQTAYLRIEKAGQALTFWYRRTPTDAWTLFTSLVISEPIMLGGLAARKGYSTQPLQVAFDDVSLWSDDLPSAPATAEPAPSISDSFDAPTLAGAWAWNAPQPGATYSLSDSPGKLRISIPAGSANYDNWAGVANAPELFRTDLPRDWTIQTTLTMAGAQPFDTCCFTAGLSVAFSADNKFIFGLEHGRNIRIERLAQYDVVQSYSSTTVDLRIEKTGNRYIFKYRPTASNPWTILSTHYATEPVQWIGLELKSWDTRANSLSADFDDFALTSTPVRRASTSTAGREADGSSNTPALSDDGRVLAFASDASNLVAGDTNAAGDIFVFDGWRGETLRVSVSGAGEQGNGASSDPAISGDGWIIAFASDATNLVPDDTNSVTDVFVYDRRTGAITRIAGPDQPDGLSDSPALSIDGQYIAFASDATNLVPDDTNDTTDIFVYDRLAGQIKRVSVDSNGNQSDGYSGDPAISASGDTVVFGSIATNLVWDDTNGASDVFVHEPFNNETRRISRNNRGYQGNSASSEPAVSPDNRYIAFVSQANNLVDNDTNGVQDIFLFDQHTQRVRRVSLGKASRQADSASYTPAISLNGRYVAFVSEATGLVDGDDNGALDVFVRDTSSGQTWRLNRSESGAQTTGAGEAPAITPDGAMLAYVSSADALVPGDTNQQSDVFLADRAAISALPEPGAPAPEVGSGLQAEYYDSADLTEPPAFTQVDPQVDFAWPSNPIPWADNDEFSVRWFGQVGPQSTQVYTFELQTDSGARLWIDDQLVIDAWANSGATWLSSPPLVLAAGHRYDIRLEYHAEPGGTGIHLAWSNATAAHTLVPSEQLYPAIPSGRRTPLSALVLVSAAQDYGQLVPDRSVQGNPIVIGGTYYAAGLGTHAESSITYALDGRYNLFEAQAGHDDESDCGNGLSFEVLVDGISRWSSPTLWTYQPAVPVRIWLSGAHTLTLQVHALGDIDCDHADWADAYLTVVNDSRGHDLAELNATGWGADTFGAATIITDDLTLHPYDSASVHFDTGAYLDWWAYYPKDRNAGWDLSGEQAIAFWIKTENQNPFQEPLSVRLVDHSTGGYIEYRWTGPYNLYDETGSPDGKLVILPLAGSQEWSLDDSQGPVSLARIDELQVHTDTWDAGFQVWLDGVMVHARGTLTADYEPLTADGVTPGIITVAVQDRVGSPAPGAPVQLGLASGEPITINGQPISAGQYVDLGLAGPDGTITAVVTAGTPGTRLLAARDDNLTLLGARLLGFNGIAGVRLQTLLPGESPDPGSPTGKSGTPDPQTAGVPFNVTLRTVDANWNGVWANDTLVLRSSDARANLPGAVTLFDGQAVISATLSAAGLQTITATSLQRPVLRSAAVLSIEPADAATFHLDAPIVTRLGVTFPLTVTARDAYGNLATGYSGTVHFSSTDSQATLPGDLSFVGGQATTSAEATLNTLGAQTISVADTTNPSLAGSAAVRVRESPTLVVAGGTTVMTDDTRYSVATAVMTGTTILPFDGESDIVSGDEILIITMLGPGIGTFETALVAGTAADRLTLAAPLAHGYDGTTSKVMIQRVVEYTSVTVQSGGTLTAHAWDGNTGGVVFFRAQDVTVANGGRIDISSKGFRPGEGPGSGNYSAGGGHGGYGGSAGALPYGLALQPIVPGSAGGHASSYYSTGTYAGKPGGGVIRIDVAGTLQVDGIVNSSGGSGTASYFLAPGGGAGGSIWLTAGTLAGAGTIQARGGTSQYCYYDDEFGYVCSDHGGAGGRILASVASMEFAGSWQASSNGSGAGPGTVVIEDTNYGSRRLRVNNAGYAAKAAVLLDPAEDAESITMFDISGAAILEIADPAYSVYLNSSNMTGDGTGLLMTHGAVTLAGSTLSQFGLSIAGDGILTTATNLTVQGVRLTLEGRLRGTQNLTLSANGTRNATVSLAATGSSEGWDPGTFALSSLTVSANQALEAAGDPASGTGVTIRANNITVATGGKITADGMGYTPAQNGPGASSTGGAGHGGMGGLVGGGLAYGSVTEPVMLGSAGNYGGAGGGAIRLVAAQTLTINGTVSAGPVGYYDYSAGGSIWLSAQTLSGAGTVRASATYMGSGGRIAASYITNSFTGVWEAAGGTAGGGAGTIFFHQTNTGTRKLLVDNLNRPGTPAILTDVEPTDWAFEEIKLMRTGSLELHDPDDTLALTTATMAGDGTGQLYIHGALTSAPAELRNFGLYIYPDGSATLPAGTTVRGVKLTNYGMLQGVQDLTLAADGSRNAVVRLAATGYTLGESAGTYTLTSLTINTSQTVEAAGDSASGRGVTIQADTITIAAGGRLTADGLGYTGAQGAPGAAEVGSLTEPVTFGKSYGYGGGGAIKLVVANTLLVNGTLSASGMASAGGGGSLWLNAQTFSGSGQIQAYGNSQGSGGRIAVYSTNNTYTGLWYAFGGGSTAAPGIVFFSDATTGSRKLLVDNFSRAGTPAILSDPAATNWSFDEIKLLRNGNLELRDSDDTITLTGPMMAGDGSAQLYTHGAITSADADLDGFGVYVYPEGTLTLPISTTIRGVKLTNYGALNGLGSLTVVAGSASNATVRLAAIGHSDAQPAGVYALDTLTIGANQTLELPGDPASGRGVTIQANRITVATGGKISADGFGYTETQKGPGAPASGLAGGAGHGGPGAPLGSNPGGPANDSVAEPALLGSASSGPGGGAIRLIVAQTLTIDGTVSANGLGGALGGGPNGGGAGGSIWLTAQALGGNGLIRANGGNGDGYPNDGGAGGGGRIAAHSPANTFTGTWEAVGGGFIGYGGAGTIYLANTATGRRTLRVDAKGQTYLPAALTDPAATNWTFDEIQLLRNGLLELADADDTIVLTPANMAGDGTGQMRLSRPFTFSLPEMHGFGFAVAQGVTLTLPLSTTVRGVPLTNDGTIAGAQDLTLRGARLTNRGKLADIQRLTLAADGPIDSAARLTPQGSSQGQASGTYAFEQVNVEASQALELAGDPASGRGIKLLANGLTVAGRVTADGLGYTFTQNGPGAPISNYIYAGAGHGGKGGSTLGGPAYGSALQPQTLGSAGYGGSGGGAFELVVTGTLALPSDGLLTANGQSQSIYGGGAGGAVLVRVGALTGSGTIRANGASRVASGSGSGGAGGRIAIFAETRDPAITISAYGGTGASPGEDGSIFLNGIDPGRSSVTIDPASVPTDGVSVARVRITARQPDNSPVAGKPVALALASGERVWFNGQPADLYTYIPVGTTDASGVVTATVAAQLVGQRTIRARVGQEAISQLGTVTFVAGPVSAANSVLSVSTTDLPADGVTKATVYVTVRDGFNNPVPGAAVVLDATNHAIITQPATPTNSAGQTTGAVGDTTDETVIVTAAANGVALQSTQSLTFRGADLSVYKSGPTKAGLGQPITYALSVSNYGRLPAHNVVLTDTLPPEVSYTSDTASAPRMRSGQVITWTIGTLAPFASVSFNLTGQVNGAIGAPFVNRLRAFTSDPEARLVDNQTSFSSYIDGPDAALSISATALSNSGYSGDTALAGYPITYTLSVDNYGQTPATGVMLTDTFTNGLIYVGARFGGAPATPTIDGNRYTWSLGTVGPRSNVKLTVYARIAADAPASITNQAAVTISNSDGYLGNNSASLTTRIEQPVPILSVVPAMPVVSLLRGQSTMLVGTIQNIGTAATSAITITGPPHMPWVSIGTPSQSALAPGAQATFQITIAPDAAMIAGTYRDRIIISGARADTRFMGLTVQVTAPPRSLAVTVQNDQGQTVPGTAIELVRRELSVNVTEGVTQTYQLSAQRTADSNGVATFGGLESGTYDYTAGAALHTNGSGALTVADVTGTQPVSITLVAQPRLNVAPNNPVLTVLPGQTVAQVITIHNPGAAPLTNVTITTPQRVPWVYLGTPSVIPTIGAGQSVPFTVFASPPLTITDDIVQDYIDISGAGVPSVSVALTVQIAPTNTQAIKVLATDASGLPITSGGNVTLIRQTPTVQVTAGITTTFNQQFSQPLDATGTAQFSGLPPGDYNYVISASGYERSSSTMSVESQLPGKPTQVVKAQVRPDPFTYSWSVTPMQVGYGITLTLTYDTMSPAPGLLIPARYWTFPDCDPQIEDTITVYNPTNISLALGDLIVTAPGVQVQVLPHPGSVGPHQSAGIPVRVTKVGEVGQGTAELDFSYQAAPDSYVTFTVNPSSATRVISPSVAYSETYMLDPVVFTPGVDYTLQISQPANLAWLGMAVGQTGPAPWTAGQGITLTLTADTHAPLAEGIYSDTIPILVNGSDGSQRFGVLAITAEKNSLGEQLHTSFKLGMLPFTNKEGASSAVINAATIKCSPGGGGGGGGGGSSGGWTWHWAPLPGGGGGMGLVGTQQGPTVSAPAFPQYIPPPVFGDDHQQVRLEISQKIMLEGEGFQARLQLENTSSLPLERISTDILITDVLSGTDARSSFTITPTIPTNLGDVAPGEDVAREWLILPGKQLQDTPAGRRFTAQAIIHYRWNGVEYLTKTAPEEITVLPAPDLTIDYELPLETLACSFFDLKATIRNVGVGPARKLRFSSAQPRMLSGRSGAPVSFAIIETLVDEQSRGQTLDLELGDLAPGDDIEVIFRLRASQPGRFVEFTSDYRQANYLGLPLKPLISQITTRFVRPDDPLALGCGLSIRSNPVAGDAVRDSDVAANPAQQSQAYVGGPIDVGTGNYHYTVNDISIQMRNGMLDFRRIYSRDRLTWKDNILGPGWTHNYNIRLILPGDPFEEGPTDDDKVVYQASNGSRITFESPNNDGVYQEVEAGFQAKLKRWRVTIAGTQVYTYSMLMDDQTQYAFDTDGYLVKIDRRTKNGYVDPTPLRLNYYDHPGYPGDADPRTPQAKLLWSISDGVRYLEFGYDSQGRIKEICDQRRNSSTLNCAGGTQSSPSIKFTYYTQGLAAGALHTATDIYGKTWTYFYNQSIQARQKLKNNDEWKQEERKPLLTEVSDPLNHTVESQLYNNYGCAIGQWNDELRDHVPERIVGILYKPGDPNIHIDCSDHHGEVEVFDGRDIHKIYKFDGGLFAGLKYAYNGKDVETSIVYDQGRPAVMTNEREFVTVQEWSDQGRRLKYQMDPLGQRTSFQYDNGTTSEDRKYGNLTAVFDPRSDLNCASAIGTPTKPCYVTRYSYEDPHFPTLVTKIETLIEIGHTRVGAPSQTTVYTYTSEGYLAQEMRWDGNQGIVTAHSYDEHGQRKRTVENCIPAACTSPDTIIFNSANPDQNRVTEFEYDAVGRPTAIIDPFKHRTSIVYDDLEHTVRTIRNNTGAAFRLDQPDRNVETLTDYDGAGRVERITETVRQTGDQITSFEYDGANRVKRVEIQYAGRSVVNLYRYDEAGNLILSTDALGIRQRTCYDVMNRPVRIIANYQDDLVDPCGQARPTLPATETDTNNITYLSYDLAGNLIRSEDPLGRVNLLVYNMLNQPVRAVRNAKGTASIGLGDITNPSDDPRSPSYQRSTAPDRDIMTTFWYDAAGNTIFTRTSQPDSSIMVCYDSLNHPAAQVVNSSKVNPDYDDLADTYLDQRDAILAQCAALASMNGGQTPGSYAAELAADKDLITFSSFDALGQVKAVTKITAPENRRTTFDYDNLGRLKRRITNYRGDGSFNPAYPDYNVTQTLDYGVIDAGGQTWLETADIRDYLGIANWPNIRTHLEFDRLHRKVRTIENYNLDINNGVFDPTQPARSDDNVTTTIGYDGFGQAITTTDTYGRTTNAEYDELGNLQQIVRNDVAGDFDPVRLDLSDRNVTTRFNYSAGQLQSMLDTYGRVTRYQYDRAGRRTSETQNYLLGSNNGGFIPNQPTLADINVKTSYRYDRAGKLIATTDTLGRTDWTCYDLLNRPRVSVQNAATGTSSPFQGAGCTPPTESLTADTNILTSVTYNPADNSVDIDDATNIRTHVVQDRLERPIEVTSNYQGSSPGNADPALTNKTFYDKNGNIVQTIDPRNRITWRCYDARDRLVRKIVNISGYQPADFVAFNNQAAPLPANHPCSVAYETALRQAIDNESDQVSDPNAEKDLITSSIYDALGRLTSTKDPLNRLTVFAYDGLSRVTARVINYHGSADFDPRDLPDFDPQHPDWNVIQQTEYGSEENGPGVRIEYTDVIDHVHAANITLRKTRFTFDRLDRQIKVVANFQGNGLDRSQPDINVTTRYAYDGVGNLRTQTDPNNHDTTLIYDDLNRLEAITDARLRPLYTYYDGAGNVWGIADGRLKTTRFEYDGMYRQRETRTPEGTQAFTHYDRLGRVVEQIDPEQIHTRLEYDSLGRLRCVVENHTGGDCAHNTFNNPNTPDQNVRTDYSYDSAGNLTGILLPPDERATRSQIIYTYDLLDRRTSVSNPLGTAFEPRRTYYDQGGRVTGLQYPNGTVQGFNGAIDDPNITRQTLTYDDLDRLTGQLFSAPTSDTIDAAHDVSFTYDGTTERIHTMLDGGTTTFGHDQLDRLTSVTDPRGQLVTYVYDAGGLRRELRMQESPSAATKTIRYDYYENDLLHFVTSWDSQQTEYLYDPANRLQDIRLPNNVNAHFDYDDDDRLTRVRYTRNNGTPAVETLMQIDYTEFDQRGNRKAVTEQTRGVINPQGEIVFVSDRQNANNDIYAANADGSNLRNLTGNSAMDFTPAWSPDAQQIAFTSTRDGNAEIYVMNADGSNVRRLTNDPAIDTSPTWSPDGRRLAFTSTRDGNAEIYVMNVDGTGIPDRLTNDSAIDSTPAWSPDGNQIAFTSTRDGNYEIYVMDAGGGAPHNVTNNLARDFGAAWSPDSRRLAFVSLRDNGSDIYIMDAGGANLRRLTRTGTLDKQGVTWSPDGTQLAYTSVSLSGVGGYEIYTIGADATGNRNITNDNGRDGMAVWAPYRLGPISRTAAYDYDGLARLKSATYTQNGSPAESYNYTYDLRGNLQTATTADGRHTRSYDYDAANQLVASRVDGQQEQGYVYDLAGNMRSEGHRVASGATVANTYRYDTANRLVRADMQGAVTTYAYNGMDGRYRQVSGGTTINYLLDMNSDLTQVLAELGGSQDIWYLPGLDILGQQRGSEWTYFGYDGLGSVRQVYAQGTPRSVMNFDPYGGLFQQYGMPAPTTLGFTGEQTDPNGLIYLRARYYNPQIGSFLSRDPVEGVLGRVMSRNGFSYVEGNPVNHTDPSGRCIGPLIFVCGLLLAGAIAGLIGGTASVFLGDPRYSVGERFVHGFLQGAIAGMLTYALTPLIIPTGAGLGFTIFASAVIGAFSDMAGQVGANLITGRDWREGVLEATVVGGIAGGVTGGVGWKIRQWFKPGEGKIPVFFTGEFPDKAQEAIVDGLRSGKTLKEMKGIVGRFGEVDWGTIGPKIEEFLLSGADPSKLALISDTPGGAQLTRFNNWLKKVLVNGLGETRGTKFHKKIMGWPWRIASRLFVQGSSSNSAVLLFGEKGSAESIFFGHELPPLRAKKIDLFVLPQNAKAQMDFGSFSQGIQAQFEFRWIDQGRGAGLSHVLDPVGHLIFWILGFKR